jgi:putative ABC transport system permease protein
MNTSYAVFQDLRYASRTLRNNPGFAAVAVLTLALGIGAATAMFTIVNSVLLRPLPFGDADQVVAIWTRYEASSGYDIPQFPLSGPEFIDYRAQTRALEEVAAFVQLGATLTTDETAAEPIRVFQVQSTANLFATLGVEPALGRTFREGEDRPGAACVVMLSHGLWLDAFGGDRGALGRTARLDGTQCEVVGIMPADFAFPNANTRLWRNANVDPANPLWGQRQSHNISAVGRLAPGVTFAEAEAEVRTLMAGWSETYDHYIGHFVFLRPYLDEVVGSVRPELTMLLGAVGLVLLVICANLASLLLARGEGRRRELAIRLALGAGRARLVTHLLTESLLLAVLGGALGVTATVAFLDGLLSFYPGALPREEAIALDWRALAFAAGVTGLTAVLFGLLPALRASSASPDTVLHANTRGVIGGRSRLMRGFVIAEVALSVMLVVGAGLLLRSYENVRTVDLGFEAEGVYTVGQAVPVSTYPDPPAVRNFFASLMESVVALPGVESAGAISSLPVQQGPGGLNDFIIEGRPQPAQGETTWNAGEVMVTPGYFETMRIPLVAGRSIEARDRRDAPWVAVINEEAVRLYWPTENPIGRRIRYVTLANQGAEPQWITIVGVVKNTRANGAQAELLAQIFLPHAQMPRNQGGRYMAIVVRAARDPLAVAAAVNATVRNADAALPPIGGQLMEDIVSTSVGQPRFTSQLATFFAVVALSLGALGIHGVLSYVVAQRVGELGVRLALGARPAALLRLVIGQGMLLAGIGVVLGAVAALAGARVLQSLLFGVSPTDPASFAVAITVLGVAAFLACYGPGRRAARIDPMTALRAE